MLRLWWERRSIFGEGDAASLGLTDGIDDVAYHEGCEDLAVAGETEGTELLHERGLHGDPLHELGSGGILGEIGTVELCQLSLTVTFDLKLHITINFVDFAHARQS